MPEMPLTGFDLAVLAVVALSALFSLFRGVVREALTIAAWVGAFVTAYYGFGPVQELAQRTIEEDWLADVAALAVVFLVPLIALKAAGAVLAEHVQTSRLRPVDRWAGVAFGLARGAFIVCVGYLGLAMVVEPDRQPVWIKDSAFLPYVEGGADLLQSLVPATGGDDGGADRAAPVQPSEPAMRG